MTTACVLAFGGNSRQTKEHFNNAIEALDDAGVSRDRIAKLIRSEPMGASAGSEFVNSAGVFHSSLDPASLLQAIHDIEKNLGRERSVHWGPRPIDIDIIFYGDQVIDDNRIVIPHPSAWYRSFVISPLAEICPDWQHPILLETVERLQLRLQERPLCIQLVDRLSTQAFCDRAQATMNADAIQIVASETNHPVEDLFCSIAPGDEWPEERTQPKNESRRIIRCPPQAMRDDHLFVQFLKDLETAILG